MTIANIKLKLGKISSDYDTHVNVGKKKSYSLITRKKKNQ